MTNKWHGIGNLTADPEMRFTVDGSAVTKFRIAINGRKKAGSEVAEVTFVPIVAWARLAEVCGEFLKKGKKVYIEGRLEIRSYDKDGETKWHTEIVASDMQMLDSKKADQ